MDHQTIQLQVTGTDDKEAAVLASSLENAIKASSKGITDVQREKVNPQSMDLGTILTVLFTSGAGVAIGHGIAAWLRSHNRAAITIKDHEGEVIASNLSSADAVRIGEIFKDK